MLETARFQQSSKDLQHRGVKEQDYSFSLIMISVLPARLEFMLLFHHSNHRRQEKPSQTRRSARLVEAPDTAPKGSLRTVIARLGKDEIWPRLSWMGQHVPLQLRAASQEFWLFRQIFLRDRRRPRSSLIALHRRRSVVICRRAEQYSDCQDVGVGLITLYGGHQLYFYRSVLYISETISKHSKANSEEWETLRLGAWLPREGHPC